MKKSILILFLIFTLPILCYGQDELIAGWRLKSIGTSKSEQTDVNYQAAAALILHNSQNVILSIVDESGKSLGPVIELKTYSIDDDFVTSNAFAISGNALLRTNNNTLTGNYTIFIQTDEHKRDVLRFNFPNNPLYLEGRLTQETFIDNLVRLSGIGVALESGGRLKKSISDIIFNR